MYPDAVLISLLHALRMVYHDNRSFPLYAMLAGVCSVRHVRFLMVMNIVSDTHFGLVIHHSWVLNVIEEYMRCGDCNLLSNALEKLTEYYFSIVRQVHRPLYQTWASGVNVDVHVCMHVYTRLEIHSGSDYVYMRLLHLLRAKLALLLEPIGMNECSSILTLKVMSQIGLARSKMFRHHVTQRAHVRAKRSTTTTDSRRVAVGSMTPTEWLAMPSYTPGEPSKMSRHHLTQWTHVRAKRSTTNTEYRRVVAGSMTPTEWLEMPSYTLGEPCYVQSDVQYPLNLH